MRIIFIFSLIFYQVAAFSQNLKDYLSVANEIILNSKFVKLEQIQPSIIHDVFTYSNPKIALDVAEEKKIKLEKHIKLYEFTNLLKQTSDTLFIFDSVYVTGNFVWHGCVLVISPGKLILDNANVFIYGDLIAVGTNANIIAKNSNIHLPQYYIYHRSILSLHGASLNFENCSLNTSQMPHGLVVAFNSSVKFSNVQKNAITTCGLSGGSNVKWNQTNWAEFILMDSSKLDLNNAETLLIWHHVISEQSLHFTFPDGQHIYNFQFADSLPGVHNIKYKYSISNVQNCMWALMPQEGSDVVISNSSLRTIGLFVYSNQNLSGFTNNSTYINFLAPVVDRNLHLINTTVQTWSLYLFDIASVNIQNCIIGEIGTFDFSQINVHNTIIDGSGGYLFLEDNSFGIIGFSNLYCDFHTKEQSIGIMAYSNQQFGRTIAKDKTIMILLQNNLISMPEKYDDAMIWYCKLEGNAILPKHPQTPIYGSAWIEKASNYYFNDIAWYSVEYSIDGNSWIQICKKHNMEIYSDLLCEWNTETLESGVYYLRLTICDNTPDSNKVNVLRQYILQPFNSINQSITKNLKVYPIPSYDFLKIEGIEEHCVDYEILDMHGRIVALGQNCMKDNIHCFDITSLPKGIYYCIIKLKDAQILIVRFVKLRDD